MYYSTESQIHINPARRENLSFISDRNLRKGQGTAPPGLHNYAVIIVLSHASTALPTSPPLHSCMKWLPTTFPGVRQARANPAKCSNYSTSEIYLWIFCSPTTARKLASGFLFVKQKLAVSAA